MNVALTVSLSSLLLPLASLSLACQSPAAACPTQGDETRSTTAEQPREPRWRSAQWHTDWSSAASAAHEANHLVLSIDVFDAHLASDRFDVDSISKLFRALYFSDESCKELIERDFECLVHWDRISNSSDRPEIQQAVSEDTLAMDRDSGPTVVVSFCTSDRKVLHFLVGFPARRTMENELQRVIDFKRRLSRIPSTDTMRRNEAARGFHGLQLLSSDLIHIRRLAMRLQRRANRAEDAEMELIRNVVREATEYRAEALRRFTRQRRPSNGPFDESISAFAQDDSYPRLAHLVLGQLPLTDHTTFFTAWEEEILHE